MLESLEVDKEKKRKQQKSAKNNTTQTDSSNILKAKKEIDSKKKNVSRTTSYLSHSPENMEKIKNQVAKEKELALMGEEESLESDDKPKSISRTTVSISHDPEETKKINAENLKKYQEQKAKLGKIPKSIKLKITSNPATKKEFDEYE